MILSTILLQWAYLGQTPFQGFYSPAPQREVSDKTDEFCRGCGTPAALTAAHRYDPVIPTE